MRSISGFRTFGVLVMALASLVANSPSASALTAGAIAFTGRAAIGGCDRAPGLGFKVNLGPAGTFTPNNCLWNLASGPMIGGQPACLSGTANLLKAKSPANLGTCFFGATGTLHGWCGLATGTGAGTIQEIGDLSLGTPNTITVLLLLFLVFGLIMIVDAALDKANGQKGWFEGTFTFAPDPLHPGNCLMGTAVSWIVTGAGVFVLN